jgi:hypothetical protein
LSSALSALAAAVSLSCCTSVEAIPSDRYAFAPRAAAHVHSLMIDIDSENQAASRQLQTLGQQALSTRPLIIVPGYSPIDDSQTQQLPDQTRRRLQLAYEAMVELDGLAILVSGGNVHPPDTPFNEAHGMKRYLVDSLGLAAERVVLEPYARHTTTNLRNAGRFMLAHGIEEGIVVTTRLQSLYIAYGSISSFRARCTTQLGYELGTLEALSPERTRFVPAQAVMRSGADSLDP